MKRLGFIIFILLLGILPSFGQFYIGHQMTFGKNRVQYRKYVWRYLRYPKYDVYYYMGEEPIAYFVGKYAKDQIEQMERFFDYDLNKRLVFITYKNLRDFKQTNLGLFTGNINTELAATTQILGNKIMIYYQDDHEKLKRQIRKAVASVIINEMLYGQGFSKKFYGSVNISLPEWYIEGLATYAADPYSLDIDNYMRDFVIHTNRKIKLNNADNEHAGYLGYSFWQFIAETYGADVITNIIYFTRVTKNLSNAFYYVTGLNFKDIEKQWNEYLQNKYKGQIRNRQPFDSSLVLKKYKKNVVYQQIRYCPANGLYAYVENNQGKYKVIIYDPSTGKKNVIFKQGNKLEQITDFSYPYLAWKPDGTTLTFVAEQKKFAILYNYDLETQKLSSAVLSDLTKIYSFSYSHNGRYLVLSAQKQGYIDIFLYRLSTAIIQRITYDPYDDLYPAFIDKDRKIIFSSDRGNDTKLRKIYRAKNADSVSRTFDLYVYDYRSRSKNLKRLTNTPYINELQTYDLGKGHYLYLSDSVGITNRMAINYDSTIDYVDTAVHYRYFTKTYPLTNYPTSIFQQDYSMRTKEAAEVKLWDKRYLISSYTQNLKENKQITENFKPTDTRIRQLQMMITEDNEIKQQYKKQQEQKRIADSIARAMNNYRRRIKDTAVNINNYTFEIERDSLLRIYYQYQLKLKHEREQKNKWGKLHVYGPTFYLNKFNTSFDYGQIVQSYQPFTGGTFVFSPGMNLFSITQVNELMEDYRIFGGFRLNNDLRSAEYIASFENLRTRLDKQIMFHRNALYQNLGFVGYNYTMTKNVINELIISGRYPFNQVASVRGTFLGRYDRKIYLATDQQVFENPPENNLFVSEKLEFIYDNSRQLSLNLYDGIRAKAFVESYQQIGGNKYWTAIAGGDFRFYKEIWRNMIFAWRFSGSTNTGSAKLIYYLGGVDYWYVLNLNPLTTGNQMFYTDVNINYDNNYIFQAVATPMRGFKQNIRNGTTFLLMNTEIRMPVFRMFFNTPATSEMLYNFQVVGFWDVGSAWCGAGPFSSCNAYNSYDVYNPPVRLIVDLERPPIVHGVGFGLRTKLLGYFVRFDFAWGIENTYVHPMQFYLSLAYDF